MDPTAFFQRIGWAHAELNVLLDLIDSILERGTLAVQPVAPHGRKRPPPPLDLAGKNAGYARSIFQRAYDAVRPPEDLGDLAQLVELRQLGWPLFKVGLGWVVNFSAGVLMNLPPDLGCVLPIDPGRLHEIAVPAVCRRYLRVTVGGSSFMLAQRVPAEAPTPTAHAHGLLTLARISTLDAAILRRLRSQHGCGASLDHAFELEGVLFELTDSMGAPGAGPEARATAAAVYRSFLGSRGRVVDIK